MLEEAFLAGTAHVDRICEQRRISFQKSTEKYFLPEAFSRKLGADARPHPRPKLSLNGLERAT